jgi:PAS domain S-box-containing protein
MVEEDLEKLYPLIFESIDQGVVTMDADFVVTSFNAAAERIVGVSREDAIGRKCHHVFRASICETGCAMRQTLETGQPVRNVRIDVLNSEMEAVPICVSTAVLRDREGRMIGGVELFRDVTELEALRQQLSEHQSFEEIIGASAAMQELFQLLPDVAASDVPVLIEGPSGSGKELIARALHRRSSRRDGPFIRINCGALPDTLLESELFGYVKGAFTDARKEKPGRFVQADGGTLLLDEIGDVSPAFQVKLLRVLQEGELEPLGATKTIKVDVRVLSATNRDLKQLVAEGIFREDLFYRLCVIPLMVPPLRDRREDIPLLTNHFVERLVARTGKPIRGLDGEAMQALVDYDFPGNIRELQNILERAFVLSHSELITRAELPPEVLESRRAPLTRPESRRSRQRLKPSERVLLRGGRRPVLPSSLSPAALRLVEVLDANDWNRSRAAEELGIARTTLWRRMREYGLLDSSESSSSEP